METGQRIPEFRAPASTGQTLSWDSYRGKVPVVMVFLPGLEDEPDIEEITEFADLLARFGRERVQIIGVVKATASDVRKFTEDREINLPILADAAGDIIASFDMAEPDGSARRATVIADRDGTVVKVFDRADPSGHAATVLNLIKELKETDEYSMAPATG